jgi:segregation and condensation protein B
MELKFILEAILFSAQQPMTPKELRGILVGTAESSEDPSLKPFKKSTLEAIEQNLNELENDHAQTARSYRLTCVNGAWQFISQPEFAPWIKTLVGHKNRPSKLSQPALETLAIIAYRQPLTRAEIEQIRGVAVDGVMQTLLERGLVEQVGRADAPGRPVTYGTSSGFLEYFGLRGLEDLPAADELRRIVVQKPEALLTVDPGLATVPPEELADAPTASSTETASPEESAPTAPAGKDQEQGGSSR